MPSTPHDAKGLLKTAIRDDNPVVFLEHKLLYFTKGDVPEREYTIPFGAAAIRRRGRRRHGGRDPRDAAAGAARPPTMLAEEGIELEVIDPRTLVPLDIDDDRRRRSQRTIAC